MCPGTVREVEQWEKWKLTCECLTRQARALGLRGFTGGHGPRLVLRRGLGLRCAEEMRPGGRGVRAGPLSQSSLYSQLQVQLELAASVHAKGHLSPKPCLWQTHTVKEPLCCARWYLEGLNAGKLGCRLSSLMCLFFNSSLSSFKEKALGH